jgi:glycerate dehydrogenase
MKIVVLDGFTVGLDDALWAPVRQLGEIELYDISPGALAVSRARDAEVLITNKTPITAELMDKCPSLRYVGVIATGYNVVDLSAASARGITVTNVPSYSTDGVVQLTFALLLEACNHVALHSADVAGGGWVLSEHFCYELTPQIALAGQTIGIVGFGSIGSAVARVALAFGMDVIAFSPSREAGASSSSDGGVRFVTLPELAAQADIVSLHCRMTPENEGFMDSALISSMKDGAILVNTARGPLVREADVAAALDSGKLSYYCADVVSAEPMKADNPLLHARNAVITPHIAWRSFRSRSRLIEVAAGNIEAFIAGRPVNVVN